MPVLVAFLLLLAACGDVAEESSASPPSRIEPSAPPPAERRPLHEGFTQRPPKDTPGLPPKAAPLLPDVDGAELEARSRGAAPEELDRAQADLLSLVAEFERTGDASGIRSTARERVRDGQVTYRTAEAFFREFLFPQDEKAAEDRYRGRVVVLTGAVAPHNMVDLADGFKLVETTPYVHEPVLLATDYELSFVRCHLARRELQMLRDWQDVHLLGIVEGKSRGDVVLRRCVVL
jgi:tRNA_anti-like